MLVVFAACTQAELLIEVTQESKALFRLRLCLFGWNGSTPLPEDVSTIVRNDLSHSGFSYAACFQHDWSPHAVGAGAVLDYQRLRQDYMVIGNIELVPEAMRWNLQVLDVSQQKEMFRHRVKGKGSQMRDLAHYISDFILKADRNARVFSTKAGVCHHQPPTHAL